MFEIPCIEASTGGPVGSVLRSLAIVGHVCSEMSAAYQYSEVSLAEAEISRGRSQYLEFDSASNPCGDLLLRKVDEVSGFRDGIAALYSESLLGYTFALHRVHDRLRSGQEVQPSIVEMAMVEKSHTAIIQELLTRPATAPRPGDECDHKVAAAFTSARAPLNRMLWALQDESVDQIDTLISSGRLDLSEIVFDSVRQVHRYAESLHFGLYRVHLR